MKKLTALILTLSMLLGMFAIPMGASAAEITEAERETILNAKTYEYVDFAKNRDYFALYQEAADYGKFNKAVDTSKTTEDKVPYTYTDSATGESVTIDINNLRPDKTYAGDDITGNEAMISKGMGTHLSSASKNANYVFLIDDFINPNGTQYSGWRYDVSASVNNGYVYKNALKRTEVKFNVGNTHKLSGPDENGNYILGYGDVQFKVGPIIPDRQLHHNGRVISSTTHELVKNSSITAKSLDLLMINSHINTNMTAANFAVGSGPLAGLQKVQIKYDGVTNPVDKWVVVTNNVMYSYDGTYSENPAEKLIIYAPKYKTNEAGEKVEIDYANNGSWMYNNGANGFKWLKGNSEGVVDRMPTSEDVKFKNSNIIMSKSGRVAQKVGTRQDTLDLSAGANADVISIPLEDKKVTSVKLIGNSTVDTIDTAIYIPAKSTSTSYTAALVPVEIENVNASEEYVYFAFVGQTASGTSLLGMTFTGESLKDKIDALNNVLAGLDSASLTEEDIASYRAQIAELKAESEYIVDADFDTSKLAEAEKRIEEEKAAEEAARQEAARQEILNSNNPEYVELDLFMDVFATHQERQSKDWYAWTTGEGEITTIWPYKGITNNITPNYPQSRSASSAGWVMMIDATGSASNSYANTPVALNTNPLVSYDEELGRYIVTAGNVKYKLGEIAEGKKGGNYASFGVKYDISSNEIADGLGIKEQKLNTDVYPNVGTSTAVSKAIYTINKSGITEINLLLANMKSSADSKGRTARVPATIEYADGTEEIILLVGDVGASIQNAIVASPKANASLSSIEADKVPANTVLGKDIKTEDILSIPHKVNKATYLPEENFILATHMRHQRTYEFDGYVNSFTIPVDPNRTIKTITFKSDATSPEKLFDELYYSKPGGSSDGYAFVPVTIKDAPTDAYNYYIETERSCGSCGIFAMTLTYPSLNDEIAELNAELDAVDAATITKEECEALRAKIEALKAKNENIKDSDFHTEALEAAEERFKAEKAEAYRTLKNVKFDMSEKNGANAKYFIDYDTYQGYVKNSAIDEEWVKGLDYSGVVNYGYVKGTNEDHTSYPTGTDSDVLNKNSNGAELANALIYKVDKEPVAKPAKYSIPFVNLTTKDGVKTWTVEGIDFAIDPEEKVVKIYTPTDASGVEDADLRARFETLNNPVLDVENGYYDSIKILAGSAGKRNITATVVYEDGTSKKLSSILTDGNTYVENVSNQDTGFLYMQSITRWSNLNEAGAIDFKPITLTGWDKTKKVDKINFTSDRWGVPVFVISAFGETATIEELLSSASVTNPAKAKVALDTVDAILAANNLEVNDLPKDLIAKYNELKLVINSVVVENNVVTVNYVNEGANDVSAVLIIAQYNADESQLVSVKKYPVTFKANGTTFTQNIETDAANKVKVLIWKDLIDFSPLYR